jgi:hypothetical protein
MPTVDPVTGEVIPDPVVTTTPPATTTPAATPPVATPATPWIGSQNTVDDSVANAVKNLASKDSELNRMAATEGLKAANRRGLLNSSMAVGAAQDSVLKNVIPIASMDAQTAAQKNAAARAFEYGMTAQEQQQAWQTAEAIAGRSWQTGERLGSQEFTTSERMGTEAFARTTQELDQSLQKLLQSNQITAAERAQAKQIESTEGIEAANRFLQQQLQESQQSWATGERIGTQSFQTMENIAAREFTGTQNQLNRDLELLMQGNQLSAEEANLIRQITSQEGIAAANRALTKTLAEKDIAFRMSEGKLDRAAAVVAQDKDIAFNKAQNAAARAMQEKIAKMNLSGTQQQGLSSAVSNTMGWYQSMYSTIMGNKDLSEAQRTQQLTNAKNVYDNGMKLNEQMYHVDLNW